LGWTMAATAADCPAKLARRCRQLVFRTNSTEPDCVRGDLVNTTD
jgi:hypothetical protein